MRLISKDGGREGRKARNPLDVSYIISSRPGDGLRKSMNRRIGFDQQRSASGFCMPPHPWPLKEPWLNVYREKVLRGLHPTAAALKSSLCFLVHGCTVRPRPQLHLMDVHSQRVAVQFWQRKIQKRKNMLFLHVDKAIAELSQEI